MSTKDRKIDQLQKLLQQLKLAKSENRPTLYLATPDMTLRRNASYFLPNDHPMGKFPVCVSLDEVVEPVVQIPYDQILAPGAEVTPGSTVLAQHAFQGHVMVVPIEDFKSYNVKKVNPKLYKPKTTSQWPHTLPWLKIRTPHQSCQTPLNLVNSLVNKQLREESLIVEIGLQAAQE